MSTTKTFYDLEADMPKGDKLSMAQLKDKVVLIVNVASKVSSEEGQPDCSANLWLSEGTCSPS
jgi:hypothetical protein